MSLRVREQRGHIVSHALATPELLEVYRGAADENSAVEQIASLLPKHFPAVGRLPREGGESAVLAISRDVVALLQGGEASDG